MAGPDLSALLGRALLHPSAGGTWTVADGPPVSVALEGERVRCRAEHRLAAPAPAELDEELEDLTLASPGDTLVEVVDRTTLRVTRSMVAPDPSDLREAVADVVRAIQAAVAVADPLVAAFAATEPAATVPPPILGTATLTVPFDHTVSAPQPGWPQPDGSVPATAQLRPGQPYAVVERRGPWARVRNQAGGECFTDAGGLVPLPPPPDRPQESR